MIRVRVMSKDKRTYRNAKGEGKLFNVLVADHTADIRLTGFNEVLDTFYDRLEVGKCYLISQGQIKQANAQCAVHFDRESRRLEQHVDCRGIEKARCLLCRGRRGR